MKNDGDAMLISRALKLLAEEAPRHRDLPEARTFWLTATLIPSLAAEERALKPMGVLHVVSHGVVAICWTIVILWKWRDIKGWFATPDVGARLLDAAVGTGSAPLSFLLILAGLLCITSVVFLHGVLAEE